MSKPKLVTLVIFSHALLLAQNTITVNASRNSAVQPDQAVFNVVVYTDTSKTLGDAIAALPGVSISASNLITVYYQPNTPTPSVPTMPQLQWQFQLLVPVANLKATTATLTSLQTALAKNHGTVSLSFSLQGFQYSGQQQSQNCDLAGLIADATASAQQKAAAAGLPLGRITGVGAASSDGTVACSIAATFMLGYGGNSGPHAISITASRSTNAQPDEILATLSLTTASSFGPDDATNELTAGGISGTTLSGVNTSYLYLNNGAQSQLLNWNFSLTVPLAKLTDTLKTLVSAAQSIPKQNPGQIFTFNLGGLQTSAQAQPACSQPTLIADANAAVQRLAGAAGVSVGPVIGLADSPGVAAARLGDFSAILGPTPIFGAALVSFPNVSFTPKTPVPTCSLAVSFQLY
jgi:hypothetical protein